MAPEFIETAREDYRCLMAQAGELGKRIERDCWTCTELAAFPEPAFVELKNSPIHGTGLFATTDFEAGQVICVMRLGGKRTVGGRYCNHSPCPNAQAQLHSGDMFLVSRRAIGSGEELTVSYLQVMGALMQEYAASIHD